MTPSNSKSSENLSKGCLLFVLIGGAVLIYYNQKPHDPQYLSKGEVTDSSTSIVVKEEKKLTSKKSHSSTYYNDYSEQQQPKGSSHGEYNIFDQRSLDLDWDYEESDQVELSRTREERKKRLSKQVEEKTILHMLGSSSDGNGDSGYMYRIDDSDVKSKDIEDVLSTATGGFTTASSESEKTGLRSTGSSDGEDYGEWGTLGVAGSSKGFEKAKSMESNQRKERKIKARVNIRSPEKIVGVGSSELDKKSVQRVIKQRQRQLVACYERELKKDPNLSGKVATTWTIGPVGRVTEAKITKNTLTNPNVGRCVVNKIKRWRFDKPKGGSVTISKSFIFNDSGKPKISKTTESDQNNKQVKTYSQASVFLKQRDQITGLTFKSPRGYWANTYLPGDSLVRTLQQRLTANQNFSIGANAPSGLELANRSGTYKQPFDSPPRAALSAFMQADKKKVDKPSRVLLQVGIQGTLRKSGQRSAMNIGVVVDMRSDFSKAEQEIFKAILAELSKSNEVGDRFSLFIAGRPGGMIIPPSSFKYGPVTVALQELFSDSRPEKKARQLTITDAYLMAIEKVAATDDPTAPLGSSLVILVTSSSFKDLEGQLSRIAHRSAVNGIPTSVIGLSDRVDPDQLDRIAISGQGNRRLVITPSQAEEVIQAELSAASRVVARAVRLRIRLAPGVKLVDVLGSKSLDEASSQKVRDAEKSIDRRLSKNLGIDSDRGEDEDGIQIVIPSFYADDSHVILLDLVVPGAGPVADLTVRYKDLVHLKNGISRTNLSLQRGESKMGPLEQNVLKNLLAYELSRILKQSGRLTAGNNYREAYHQLNQFVGLLKNLKQEIKGFSTDPELESDLELVMSYLLALDSARRGNLARTEDLSDSLFYAGHLKLLGPR